MKITKIIVSSVLVLNLVQVCFAVNSKVGTTGAQFLKIGTGCRPIAMGGAQAALADDVHAMYWNPGGLGHVEAREVMAQHIIWFQDIAYEYLAVAYPLETIGTFGFSASYVSAGDIEKRTSDTNDPEGTYTANDLAVGVSYGRMLGRKIGVGLNLKYIKGVIDNYSATAFAVDLGALYHPNKSKLSVGLAVQNIGSELKYINEGDPLPLNIKLGFGYRMLRDEALTFALDVNYPNDNDINAGVGAEYVLEVGRSIKLPLRVGYKTLNDFDTIDGLSAGVGFKIERYSLDVAWVPYGDLGDTYRISLMAKF
ncbi:MAG: PorV/PorQ family protein [Elusimicrobiota bacterium]